MPADHLPPLLARSYQALAAGAPSPHHAAMLRELDAVSRMIEMAVQRGAPPIPIEEARTTRSGITAVGDKVCPCCLQPFAKKAN